MKAAAFQELLERVRDADAYLKGNRKAVVCTDRITEASGCSQRGRRTNVDSFTLAPKRQMEG